MEEEVGDRRERRGKKDESRDQHMKDVSEDRMRARKQTEETWKRRREVGERWKKQPGKLEREQNRLLCESDYKAVKWVCVGDRKRDREHLSRRAHQRGSRLISKRAPPFSLSLSLWLLLWCRPADFERDTAELRRKIKINTKRPRPHFLCYVVHDLIASHYTPGATLLGKYWAFH